MKLLLSWLAEFVDVRVEARRLAEDMTLAGLAVDAVEPHGEDAILDIDITTNRVDCMNVYGLAREVSVLYGLPLRPLGLAFHESGPPASKSLEVEIEAPELCPRFCARVLDIRGGPAPALIRDRLEAVGVRPINAVVDLTNYVMMEMGHPSHAFDLARIPGGRLGVRWARPGERLVTLDGVERRLEARVGVVAGEEGALALAGIMGGAASEVSDATRTVALEAAYWEPLAIRRGAKALGMHTEASHRFERGADPEGPLTATARIAHLLQQIGAGSTRPGLIDVHPAPRPRRSAPLRPRRLAAIVGAEIPGERAKTILEGLGFEALAQEDAAPVFAIPTWRSDVAHEIDLIEEVVRHHGLGKVPSTIPAGGTAGGLRSWQAKERKLRDALVGAGLTEVINYSFVSEAAAQVLAGPRAALENPLSEEQAVLRNALVVPGLLTTLQTNLRHGRRDVRVFELGRVFRPAADAPAEERRMGMLLAGGVREPHWSGKVSSYDFFDGKGILTLVLGRIGAADLDWSVQDAPGFLHPGKAATILWRGQQLGFLGAVHPEQAAAWELPDETIVAEVNVDPILAEAPVAARVRALDRFPGVSRDLSILCDTSTTASDVLAWVGAGGGSLLRSVTVVDRYDRPPVPEGKVSLTVALLFQDSERTLTGDEVQRAVDQLARELRRRGAEIRGE